MLNTKLLVLMMLCGIIPTRGIYMLVWLFTKVAVEKPLARLFNKVAGVRQIKANLLMNRKSNRFSGMRELMV